MDCLQLSRLTLRLDGLQRESANDNEVLFLSSNW